MKEKITLPGRGLTHYLNRVGGEDSKKYILETKFHIRIGLIEGQPNNYSFIDPAGGPFIQVGDIIEGNKVKAIYSIKGQEGFFIEFE